MPDGVDAYDPLCAKRDVDQVIEDLPFRGRFRPGVPTKMPVGELVGLEHPRPLRNRQDAVPERLLQRALTGLAASPKKFLFDQHIVINVADSDRPVLANHADNAAVVFGVDGLVPALRPFAVTAHLREIEAEITDGNISKRVRPILEYRSV